MRKRRWLIARGFLILFGAGLVAYWMDLLPPRQRPSLPVVTKVIAGPNMITRLRRAYATDSGMYAIWEPTAFSGVHDYATWEEQLLNDPDIERHIGAGHFVPINVHSDGISEIEVRIRRG